MADDQFSGKRLYYGVRSAFLLVIGADVFQIGEPIGWDKILMSLTFDKTLKGFKFEFSDKDVTLEFDERCGFSKLRALWLSAGIDAQAGLKFGQIDNTTSEMTVYYEARLDFSTYTEDIFKVKLQCERQSLNVKFMARRETNFEIEKTESLGGDLKNLAPLQTYNCFLHPPFKTLKANFIYNANIDTNSTPTYQLEVDDALNQVKTWVPPYRSLSNEIPDFLDPLAPTGELIYSGLNLPNGEVKKSITLKGHIAFEATYTRSQFLASADVGFYIYKKSRFAQDEKDDFISTGGSIPLFLQHHLEQEAPPVTGKLIKMSVDFNITFELLADEAVFMKTYGSINADVDHKPTTHVDTMVWVDTNTWYMNVTNYDFIRPTIYPAYKLYDVLNRMLVMITDKATCFKSDFFSTGLGKDHFCNSGKQIRSIPGATLTVSARDFLPSCDALWNMGGNFERDNDGNEWFRYEPMGYFFRDYEMLKLDVISDYNRTPALENIFNELEFGFKKYPQGNEEGSALDFMTKFNFLTTIQTFQQKLSQVCNFLLSPYYISYAIQNSFEVNQTKQFDTDNDVFLFSNRDTQESSYDGEIIFDNATKQIIFPVGIAVVRDEQITITGTASNNNTYVVKEIVWDNLNAGVRTVIYLNDDVVLVNETALVGHAVYSAKWTAKRDEQFDIIKNVDSPGTTYNLQHHIKIMFKRWAKFFLSGIIYTPDSATDKALIKYMSSSNNKLVETTLKAAEPQTPMSPVFRATNPTSPDIDRLDERAADLEYPIFGKSKIKFRAPMTFQLMDRLRKAFEGRDPEDKNYGYMTYKNPNGVYEKGYLQDLKFSPTEQMGTFELIEKYNNG